MRLPQRLAGMLALSAACSAACAQSGAIAQQWQTTLDGQPVMQVYGYMDPATCVVFAAPEIVVTLAAKWHETYVLVPSGHYEPVAATYAATLNIGGQTGWRLPSLAEVASYKQVAPSLYAPTLNVAYWSSDVKSAQAAAWRVANVTSWYNRSGVYAGVWPVRDGNCGSAALNPFAN